MSTILRSVPLAVAAYNAFQTTVKAILALGFRITEK